MGSLKEMYERIKCREYDQYIKDHTSNVWKSYEQFIKPHLTDDNLISKCDELISQHDKSKWSPEEYDAYAHYFYIDKDNPDETSFDYAWLTHLHRNPHHHQYWVLIRDEGEKEPLDMPEEYIIEMLCDWHSFSAKKPESTAWQWYEDNQSDMVLSENTKQLINKYIEFVKEPLT